MLSDSSHEPVRTARALLIMGETLARYVALILRHSQYSTAAASDLEDARLQIADSRPDLTVIDLDENEAALELACQAGTSRCVLVLTRRRNVMVELSAFAKGADDFILAPFTPDEIVARSILCLRRKCSIETRLEPTIRLGALELDLADRGRPAPDAYADRA